MVENRPACATFPRGAFQFQNPTPDKSRMEALSKLGLAQRRTQSVTHSKSVKSGTALNTSADHCHSPAPALTSAEVTHSDFNSYGGKSIMLNPTLSFREEYRSHRDHDTQTIAPVKEDNSSSNRTSNEGLPKRKASHSEALVKQPPARHQSPAGSGPAPLSPELHRKSLPKPSFRTPGVTVQFSGRGATDEARRDALRRLDLLRDTS